MNEVEVGFRDSLWETETKKKIRSLLEENLEEHE